MVYEHFEGHLSRLSKAIFTSMAKKSNPYLVVKSNKLINARLNGMTWSQFRFFESLIAQIEKDQPDFTRQRVYLKDFVREIGTKNKNEYQRAREITKSLMEHVLEIVESPTVVRQVNIFHEIVHNKNLPYVEVVFHPRLKPYLLQLKEKFTAYDIRNILPLSSIYAAQIYQFLKQYSNIGTRTFKLDELKQILGVQHLYERYYDFKKRILIPSQKDLTQHCDLTFTFEEMRKGRKIDAIKFTIIPQNNHIPKGITAGNDDRNKDIQELLEGMGLSRKLSEEFVETHEEEQLKSAVDYVLKRYDEGKVKNVAGYLKKIIEDDFQEDPPILKEREREKREKKDYAKQQQEARQKEQVLIKQFQEEYEQYRESVIQQLLQQATEKEWAEFTEYAAKNVLIKQRVFTNGRLDRKKQDTLFWFRVFLTNRLPDQDSDFPEWVSRKKGFQIKRVGEGDYKIVGKQEILF